MNFLENLDKARFFNSLMDSLCEEKSVDKCWKFVQIRRKAFMLRVIHNRYTGYHQRFEGSVLLDILGFEVLGFELEAQLK